MGKLTKTLVMGGLIAGALVAFSKTKKGQLLHKKLTSQAEDLYESVEARLKKAGKVTRTKYEEAVDVVVNLYAKNKGLTKDAAAKISKELKARWSAVQLSVLYAEVKSELSDAAEISKKSFEDAAEKLVKTYEQSKKMTKAEAKSAAKELKARWKDFKDEVGETE